MCNSQEDEYERPGSLRSPCSIREQEGIKGTQLGTKQRRGQAISLGILEQMTVSMLPTIINGMLHVTEFCVFFNVSAKHITEA